jgi:hypothetical protein
VPFTELSSGADGHEELAEAWPDFEREARDSTGVNAEHLACLPSAT